MKKVGIFGGTFNPIHWGHLLSAETALEQGSLTYILWVPTSHAPYKAIVQSVSFHDRHQMVRLAIESHPQFVLAPDAISASGYAVDTLKALQQHYGTCEWHWILGLDAFQALPRWVGRRELVPQCSWLVVPRWTLGQDDFDQHRCAPADAGSKNTLSLMQVCCHVAEQLQSEAIEVRWQLLQMPLVQVSSSLVRQLCQQQRSIRYLVPDSVQEYIADHHLYRDRP